MVYVVGVDMEELFKEKISIIIPVYNVELYVEECLKSVLSQTYTNIEVIVVDDGSTDGSGKICDKFSALDQRIRVIHKSNGGVSSARNTGLDVATGNWIGFVDPDDLITENMYEYLYMNAIKYDVGVAVCGYMITSNRKILRNNKCTITKELFNWSKSMFELFNGEGRFFCAVWNKLYRKDLVRDIRFSEDITNGEDLLFNYHVLKKLKDNTIFYDAPLYCYFVREESACNSNNFKEQHLTELKVYDYIYNELKNSNCEHEAYLKFIEQYRKSIINILCRLAYSKSSSNEMLFKELNAQYNEILRFCENKSIKEYIKAIVTILPYNLANIYCSCMYRMKLALGRKRGDSDVS